MAVRRSARLRSHTPPEVLEPKLEIVNSLPSVTERDEPADPPTGTRTPVKSLGQTTPNGSNKTVPAGVKTPSSAALRPTLNEMHPSKVRQSTAKQPDSGLILGFNPVKRDANGNIVKDTVVNDTPSKAKASPFQYGTPGYEFRFSCQESQLSEEAKKLMESVREDVAKIKTQMAQDKGKQIHEENLAEKLHGDRKIAKPKGKAGRFSDAHMAEFKKMDSIAGHPSAFRAMPGRFQPVIQPTTQPVAKSLKRTNSKARLDEGNEQASPSKPPVKRLPAPAAASVKRARHYEADDASTCRPSSKEEDAPKLINGRPRNVVRSSLMTPTKSSMARTSASVRPWKKSKIPSLGQSPSKTAPHTPRTEFNPRFRSQLPTLSGLKSILRRHQPLFSKDPVKIASGTHVAAPDFSLDILLAGTGDSREPHTPSPKKQVDFTASTKSPPELTEASPSPTKVPAIQMRPESDITYPTLPAMTPEKASTPAKPVSHKTTPSIRQVLSSDAITRPPYVLGIPSVPHGITNKKRNREEADDDVGSENVPPVDAIERSTKRVKISTPPAKPLFTSSPLKGQPKTPRLATPGRAGTPASAIRRRGALSVSRLNMLAAPKRRA